MSQRDHGCKTHNFSVPLTNFRQQEKGTYRLLRRAAIEDIGGSTEILHGGAQEAKYEEQLVQQSCSAFDACSAIKALERRMLLAKTVNS
jgi:hypothetical protein